MCLDDKEVRKMWIVHGWHICSSAITGKTFLWAVEHIESFWISKKREVLPYLFLKLATQFFPWASLGYSLGQTGGQAGSYNSNLSIFNKPLTSFFCRVWQELCIFHDRLAARCPETAWTFCGYWKVNVSWSSDGVSRFYFPHLNGIYWKVLYLSLCVFRVIFFVLIISTVEITKSYFYYLAGTVYDRRYNCLSKKANEQRE